MLTHGFMVLCLRYNIQYDPYYQKIPGLDVTAVLEKVTHEASQPVLIWLGSPQDPGPAQLALLGPRGQKTTCGVDARFREVSAVTHGPSKPPLKRFPS